MSPIRDWTSLEACREYADAVYFGLASLTMRANANAFSLGNLSSFVEKCHGYGIKAYLTVNSALYNNDLAKAEKIIKKAKRVGVDAVIIWDPAAIQLAKNYKIPFFISTQANVSNWQSAEFYKRLGAKRIVLAREMNLNQIKEVRKKVNVELEVFVHGAMCLSVSGRCILSAYMYGKSANCGSCGQPCRKEWTLEDDEGNKISSRGRYFLSAKDLCMIEHVPKLIKAGVDAFKIEGRRRDPRYIRVTSKCYREAVEAFAAGKFTKNKVQQWKRELSEVYNREFSTGFYFGEPGKEGINYGHDGNVSKIKKIAVGKVVHYYPKIKVAEIKLSDHILQLGQQILIEGNTTYIEQAVDSMQINKKDIKNGKKGERIAMRVKNRVRINDKVFLLK